MKLVTMLQLAGVMHLGLIAAGATMPRAVDLSREIARLPRFIRRLFWVYYGFIGFCLVGFGALSLLLASELASGSLLARAVCGFLALFWTVRLGVATFVFDVRPYLRGGLWKVGYHATNVAFVILPMIYAWAAVKGVAR